MTRQDIKRELDETKDFLENEYGEAYYKYICNVFAEINEKLALLDGLLTMLKSDLTDAEYEIVIKNIKKALKEEK